MSQTTPREPVAIPETLAGERLDRALALLTGRPRSEVAALIDAGAVSIDGVPALSRHRRVASGELLEVPEPEPSAGERIPVPVAAVGEVPFVVVHEDEDLLVIDKPAGVVVHPGAGHQTGTLVSGLLALYPDLVAAAQGGGGDPTRPGIVHRLDKDTSGLLVVARKASTYESLVAQLSARTVARRYRSVVLGKFAADEGVVDAPIGRSARDPTRMAVRTSGKPARTHYLVQARHQDPVETSLAQVTLETGRTHQIRVHLAAIGHPILGDARYGGTSREIPMGRPFLHAEHLAFVHPRTGVQLEWTSALPEDLLAVLESLS